MPAYINTIGVAVPENSIEQRIIAEFMVRALQLDTTEARKLHALYRSTKIQKRHSVLRDYGQKADFEFYPNTVDIEPFPTVSQRMGAYQKYALPLAERAIKATQAPYCEATHLIVVSCTGLYAPGLDIELVQRLGLSHQIRRTCINFMGCYGAFNGLKVAQAIVEAHPAAKVLLVCVELCTLHFQKKKDDNNLLSNALFADGAAAVWIESMPRGISLKMKDFRCDLLLEGSSDMAWQVGDFGFEMVLSAYIPHLVKGGIKTLVEKLYEQNALQKADFYAIHPGGRAILEACEAQLGISPDDNRYAYDILRSYGNMSSCTVLFVLHRLMQDLTPADHHKHIFSAAFGPGLTLETGLLEIVVRD
ncbi:MAG: type III polyketide synthase [Runella sp.]